MFLSWCRTPRSRRFRPEPLLLEDRTLLTAGFPDPSFGNGGKATIGFNLGGFGIDIANAVAIQPNGKIVVAGYGPGPLGNDDFAVIRLNADGSLDGDFAGDGKQTIAFDLGGSNSDLASAVAIQPDGKIVLAGSTFGRMAIVRLNADGSMDDTFNGNGKQTVTIGDSSSASDVALQADDKIVIVGSSRTGDNTDFAVVRLKSDGLPDGDFDGDGIQTIAFDIGGFKNDNAVAVGIQTNGNIVVAGTADIGTFEAEFGLGSYRVVALAQLLTDGSLDMAFNNDGKQTASFSREPPFSYDDTTDMALQTDGKIVVVGSTYSAESNSRDFGMVRLTTEGSLDSTFSSDGKLTIAMAPGHRYDDATSVAIQSDGKIIVVGSAAVTDDADFAVARVNPDGSLDPHFGINGKIVIPYSSRPGWKRAYDVAIQADGKIIIVGPVSLGGDYEFGVMRVDNQGIPLTERNVFAYLKRVKRRGKTPIWMVVMAYRDGGQTIRQFRSPLQKGVYRQILASAVDTKGDGVIDTIFVTGRRGKRKVTRRIGI